MLIIRCANHCFCNCNNTCRSTLPENSPINGNRGSDSATACELDHLSVVPLLPSASYLHLLALSFACYLFPVSLPPHDAYFPRLPHDSPPVRQRRLFLLQQITCRRLECGMLLSCRGASEPDFTSSHVLGNRSARKSLTLMWIAVHTNGVLHADADRRV